MNTRATPVRKMMETPARPPQESSNVAALDATDAARVEAIWAASQDADNPTFCPREGWWSLVSWATTMHLLHQDGLPIGIAAIDGTPGDEVAEARLALLPSARQMTQAASLVDQELALAYEAHCMRTHLYTSSTATWPIETARQRQFSLLRTQHVMLRPAQTKPLPTRVIEDVQIRPLREGEEPTLLDALNLAWASTWNFHPLTSETLLADLKSRRADFFVALTRTDETHIIGTVHALFDAEARNPDEQPYAWISNLTIDPAWRYRSHLLVPVANRSSHHKGAERGTSFPLRGRGQMGCACEIRVRTPHLRQQDACHRSGVSHVKQE